MSTVVNLTPATDTVNATVTPTGAPATGTVTGVMPPDVPAPIGEVTPTVASKFQATMDDLKEIFVDIHGTVVTVLPFIEQIEQQFARARPSGASSHVDHSGPPAHHG